MTREAALRRARALGLVGYVREIVTSPERRAAAKAEYARAQADFEDLSRRIEAQFGAERKAIARRRGRAQVEMAAYKFELCRPRGPFNDLVAQGDTWEEAFRQVDVRKGGA